VSARDAPLTNPRLIRSYDLRGQVGTDLTEADATALGRSYATALQGGRRVAVGYDGRLSSPALESALVDGLVAGGARVQRIGLGPTGMLYHAVHSRALDGGIMVTGSHNPPDQNGFKLLLGTEPLFGEALAALVKRHGGECEGGSTGSAPVFEDYVQRLLAASDAAPPLRVGWDPGNGAAGDVLARLVERLPGEHRIINGAIDGHFPAHHPDPSVPGNLVQLQALVREKRLDLGIAFDGDGDRIGVVDAQGEILWPDQLVLLLGQDLLRSQTGASIVADVKSSHVLFDGIAAAGGRPVMAPSGYVLIRQAMLREGAPMAGEMSGHIFFADQWTGTDDALHVAMRLLAALGRIDLPGFRATLPRTVATPELRLPCPDARKQEILAAVAAGIDGPIDRTDGLRVTRPEGWWLLRASGTEPKLTARIEAWDKGGLETLRADLFGRLAKAGLEPRSSC
jgi:phosphomannomutase